MKPIEIYIHIPFCLQKCRYCDFLSYAASDETKEKYLKALVEEMTYYAKDYAEYEVDTIFIGGGTPSCIDAKWIEKIMECIRMNYKCNSDWEVSMEANPGTVTKEKLECYKRAGINRISFGLQSAHNEELQMLGRIHTYEEFEESFRLARETGFANINVDLMSALPGQNLRSYKETLSKVIELEPEHISAYSLIVEEGTDFYNNMEWLESVLPSEDEEREMYTYTGEFLASKGYLRYEISNYAKPGMECRHNVGYWRRKDYVGFGLGAASCVNNVRFCNTSDMSEYVSEKTDGDWMTICKNVQSLSKEEQMEETMFLGLRMTEGVDVFEFEKAFGDSVQNVYENVLEKCKEEGLLSVGEYVSLTSRGIDVSNYVMAQFLF